MARMDKEIKTRIVYRSAAFMRLVKEGLVDYDKPHKHSEALYGYSDAFQTWDLGPGYGTSRPWQGGDYTNSTDIEFSNYRRLLQDYPDLLIDNSDSRSFGLEVDASFGVNDDSGGADALVDILQGLAYDYPAYDEEDMTAVVDEWAIEGWRSFTASDIADGLQKLTGLEYELGNDAAFYVFTEVVQQEPHNIIPRAEAHESIVWEGALDQEVLRDLAWALSLDHLPEEIDTTEATPLGLEIAGQVWYESLPYEAHGVHRDQAALFTRQEALRTP